MKKNYNHILYRKDNLYYSLIIEARLSIGKIRIVTLKRNKDQKRVDMAEFYMPYTKFRAVLSIWKQYYNARQENKFKYISGKDGKRALYVNIKDNKIGFRLYDNLTKESIENYTGDVGFQIKEYEDIVELFLIEKTISNWEVANINKIMNGEKGGIRNDSN